MSITVHQGLKLDRHVQNLRLHSPVEAGLEQHVTGWLTARACVTVGLCVGGQVYGEREELSCFHHISPKEALGNTGWENCIFHA